MLIQNGEVSYRRANFAKPGVVYKRGDSREREALHRMEAVLPYWLSVNRDATAVLQRFDTSWDNSGACGLLKPGELVVRFNDKGKIQPSDFQAFMQECQVALNGQDSSVYMKIYGGKNVSVAHSGLMFVRSYSPNAGCMYPNSHDAQRIITLQELIGARINNQCGFEIYLKSGDLEVFDVLNPVALQRSNAMSDEAIQQLGQETILKQGVTPRDVFEFMSRNPLVNSIFYRGVVTNADVIDFREEETERGAHYIATVESRRPSENGALPTDMIIKNRVVGLVLTALETREKLARGFVLTTKLQEALWEEHINS